ncbi:carboxylesterase family protein [Tautonia plasticadhaerens]|uniref:Alpha/beta hydrolase family protein n=1 Tax=Tautonia plasticadhaerens TaxID=2527974 RepID=A0A518GY37_9BACT|nr:alpha/beta hydrolase [Tautonia plasticadhaerens]QDV33507.1 Alpha/beta hydrolase family protein [Tautonia plasticadhaerens]
MIIPPRRRSPFISTPGPATALLLVLVATGPRVRADQVVLKNGGLISGVVERDNALVTVFDGLKRTVIRQTKIERVSPEPASDRQRMERFSLVQPLEVHGGEMPSHALRVRSTEWDDFGQRMFEFSEYNGRSLRPERMKQAINEIGPDVVKFRGIDGFWVGQVATGQVPRPVILGLLDRVDPTNQNERLRVGRFLIQAKWYDEALAELDRLAEAFPDLAATVANVRGSVRDLQARQAVDDADRLVAVGQPRAAEERLTTFGLDGVSPAQREAVDRRLRDLRSGLAAHRQFASELRSALDLAPDDFRRDHRSAVTEILQALENAPDAVAPRLEPARPALDGEGKPVPPEVRLCRALSAWVVGPEHAVDEPAAVRALWDARDRIVGYLISRDGEERARLKSELEGLSIPAADGTSQPFDLGLASRIIRQLPPPLASLEPPPSATPLIRRVIDEVNSTPTEYSVLLPPEYHPQRRYPTVVALHDGRGPKSALEFWGPEASRNGFIVIAPQYLDEGSGEGESAIDYRYSSDEHAAVLLSLRDARKRFSIDPDRIHVGGSMLGGNAAWDVGLAHPDVFAGAVTLSGLPAKHVSRTRAHGEYLPLYVVIGELTTASTEALVFDMVKDMIGKAWDVTYVEYIRRGLEPLPEELPAAFDWMSRRIRTPRLKDFEVVSSRPAADRFFGVVIREFAPGRTPAPETVDALGTKLDPATLSCKTNSTLNLLSLTVGGINALDLWIDPEFLDLDERIQIRINGKRYFNDLVKPDLGALLEDVRIRGDRTQLYWAKISLGGKRAG